MLRPVPVSVDRLLLCHCAGLADACWDEWAAVRPGCSLNLRYPAAEGLQYDMQHMCMATAGEDAQTWPADSSLCLILSMRNLSSVSALQ